MSRQTVAFAWDYLVLDLVYVMSLKQTQEEKDRLFGQDLEWRYLDLT